MVDPYLDPTIDSDDDDTDMSDADDDSYGGGKGASQNGNRPGSGVGSNGSNSLGAGILSKKEITKEETRNKILGAVVSSFVVSLDKPLKSTKTINGSTVILDKSSKTATAVKRKYYPDTETTIQKTCHYLESILTGSLKEVLPNDNSKTGKELRKRRRILGPVSWRSEQTISKHFASIINQEYLVYLQKHDSNNNNNNNATDNPNYDSQFTSTVLSKPHLVALQKVWTALLATAAVDQNHEIVRIETAIAAGSYLSFLNGIINTTTTPPKEEAVVKTAVQFKTVLIQQLKELKEKEQSTVVKTRLTTVASV